MIDRQTTTLRVFPTCALIQISLSRSSRKLKEVRELLGTKRALPIESIELSIKDHHQVDSQDALVLTRYTLRFTRQLTCHGDVVDDR